mmetsp:Transcript_46/g.76  ORF Transcript_46/g.76 Transcript_46/m.76 type:complete len:338 (+) Transcript_46:137-1150(+)|eukprot:CAMPEP_0184683930 /NCGR_PEP_ID=MMETSP0312-20130426/13239_1 /TAXON_ID=31354 /ORGANISM="Compsopogon coeruleus, Strain SAG 36.94" /LENGTH=337 /DNA_ID=CAMNT_0027136661 /DNA_START=114 /DNA_END=1127 /DNA_ORIENTATION=-
MDHRRGEFAFLPCSGTQLRVPGSSAVSSPRRPAWRLCEPRPGDDSTLSRDVIQSSPALVKEKDKYLFPMRSYNTEVFFDNDVNPVHTVMVVFCEDRHGLVLDTLSILESSEIQCHKFTSTESDAMKLLFPRLESELTSFLDLGLSLENCSAFYLSDKDGDKLSDPELMERLTTGIKIELGTDRGLKGSWHRVVAQKMRHNPRLTSIAIQTDDRESLLNDLTQSLVRTGAATENAIIKTIEKRIEDTFYVHSARTGLELDDNDIYTTSTELVKAAVGPLLTSSPNPPAVWCQYRNFWELCVAEAIVADEEFLARYPAWESHPTPNFRGQLVQIPYVRL